MSKNQNQDRQANGNQDAGNDQDSSPEIKAAGATQDKDAQRRGGEHSHSGSQSGGHSARSGSGSEEDESGSSDRGSGGSNQPRGAAVDKDAQRKGGQHSHGGNR